MIRPEAREVLEMRSEGSVSEIHIAANDVDFLLGNNGARLWSLRTHEPIGPLLLPNGKHDVDATALTMDGNIAAAVSGRNVFVWRARSGELLTDSLPHASNVEDLSFTPNGERLITVTDDGTRLWDVATGVALKHHKVDSSFAHALMASDGSRIAVGCTVRTELFDVVNGSADGASVLATVAEAVGGFRVNVNGAIEPVEQRAEVLRRARAKVLQSQAASDSSAQFLRWFLADRASRQPSPFRTVVDVHSPTRP